MDIDSHRVIMNKNKTRSDIYPDIPEEAAKAVARVIPLKVLMRDMEGDRLTDETIDQVREDLLTIISQLGRQPDEVLLSGIPDVVPDYGSKQEERPVISFGEAGTLKALASDKNYYAKNYNAEFAKKRAGLPYDKEAMQRSRKNYTKVVELLDVIDNSDEEYATYFFGGIDDTEDTEGGGNPLMYMLYGGSVGIYDKSKIMRLCKRCTSDYGSGVVATQSEIEDALLCNYVPRFTAYE